MTNRPMPDAQAPALSLPLVGGGQFKQNDPAPQNFTMVVFYRGRHCPVCQGYLEKLNGLMPGYRDAGFSVVAVSMDTAEKAKDTMDSWKIGDIPVAYGLSEADARGWGLYISHSIKEGEASVFCEPGMAWVRPDGRLYMIDISNMPWARPDLEFLLSKVPMAVDKGYPARGGH